MFSEAAQAPAAVARQLQANQTLMGALGARLRAAPPRAVLTCARGSSDHAATFARYLIETRLGLLTSSASPSVSSVYASATDLEGALFLAISQSGASPDLLAAARAARTGGAVVVAMVNTENSPLAALADEIIPLRAGPELAVAATKSYIASLAAVAHLTACWSRDDSLVSALQALPRQLDKAWALDWTPAAERLRTATNLYVVSRGVGFGVAQEAALKLKETCGLHAEAFSAAELRHGPMALVGPDFPVLVLSVGDETRTGLAGLLDDLIGRSTDTLIAGPARPSQTSERAVILPRLGAHPALEPLLLIQSFYRMAIQLSVLRGRDPDRPPHLRKVTRTV